MGSVWSLILFDRRHPDISNNTAIVDVQHSTVHSNTDQQLRQRQHPDNVAEEEQGGALYL